MVSVIIPVYNVKDYLEDCFQSVLGQQYKELEIILVNNNSTDGSDKIMTRLKNEHKQVIILEEKKQGACAARNKGLSVAKGEYIQFLDADDLLEPDKISHQLNLIKSSEKKADIVFSNYKRRSTAGTDRNMNVFFPDVWLGLMKSKLGITSANLFKRSKVLELNGWNEEIKSSQEYDLMFRMLKTEAIFVYDKEYKTIVRDRVSGNISGENLARNWKTFCELRVQIVHQLKKKDGEVHQEYWQALFDSIRQLYKYDKETAYKLFKHELPSKFSPVKSEVSSASYLFFYKLLGFRGAESMRKLTGKG